MFAGTGSEKIQTGQLGLQNEFCGIFIRPTMPFWPCVWVWRQQSVEASRTEISGVKLRPLF